MLISVISVLHHYNRYRGTRMSLEVGNLLFTLLGLVIGLVADRFIFNSPWNFRGRRNATLSTLPLNTRFKVIGPVPEEFDLWAIEFEYERSCGFLLNLDGVGHTLRAGDIFQVLKGSHKSRTLDICPVDQTSEWIAQHL